MVGSGVLSETTQLRHVLHKRSRKQHTTSNTAPTETKSGPSLPPSLALHLDRTHATQSSLPKSPRALGKISRLDLL